MYPKLKTLNFSALGIGKGEATKRMKADEYIKPFAGIVYAQKVSLKPRLVKSVK